MDQIWAWLPRGHRLAVGVRDPLKSSVTGPSLLVNCYIETKFHKKIRVNKEAKAAENKSKDFDFGILKHLLNINQLVRSIREASFDLFVASLKKLCPLLTALDHIHYSRWIPVFILDLKLLNVSDPANYHSFSKGYFVARKTDTAFSKIRK